MPDSVDSSSFSRFKRSVNRVDFTNFLRYQQLLVKKGKGSPYSITERRVPELIPVLGSQPAGDVSHKPGGRLPLFSARPAVPIRPLCGGFAAGPRRVRDIDRLLQHGRRRSSNAGSATCSACVSGLVRSLGTV